ncbi:hypothetical protein PVAG01_08948 [Phlyctema vagabunda]|uniref:Uncharacterized protein n=1 Tax=Phlyctema vagabunda TaxID=108571 RepID=A0ABR4PAY7_9HELO
MAMRRGEEEQEILRYGAEVAERIGIAEIEERMRRQVGRPSQNERLADEASLDRTMRMQLAQERRARNSHMRGGYATVPPLNRTPRVQQGIRPARRLPDARGIERTTTTQRRRHQTDREVQFERLLQELNRVGGLVSHNLHVSTTVQSRLQRGRQGRGPLTYGDAGYDADREMRMHLVGLDHQYVRLGRLQLEAYAEAQVLAAEITAAREREIEYAAERERRIRNLGTGRPRFREYYHDEPWPMHLGARGFQHDVPFENVIHREFQPVQRQSRRSTATAAAAARRRHSQNQDPIPARDGLRNRAGLYGGRIAELVRGREQEEPDPGQPSNTAAAAAVSPLDIDSHLRNARHQRTAHATQVVRTLNARSDDADLANVERAIVETVRAESESRSRSRSRLSRDATAADVDAGVEVEDDVEAEVEAEAEADQEDDESLPLYTERDVSEADVNADDDAVSEDHDSMELPAYPEELLRPPPYQEQEQEQEQWQTENESESESETQNQPYTESNEIWETTTMTTTMTTTTGIESEGAEDERRAFVQHLVRTWREWRRRMWTVMRNLEGTD